MSWPLRALLGPMLWALAFSVVYAAHGIGCARNWPAWQTRLGDMHQMVLIGLWGIAVVLASVILWRAPRGAALDDKIARAGGWIGLVATALTLFPVLGLTTCGSIL